MANIISLICFSNANNDTANNGSDFRVSACECTPCICVFLLFPESSGDWHAACFDEPARRRVRAPYVFPEDDAVKMWAEWGWALQLNTNLSLSFFCLAVNGRLKLHANLLFFLPAARLCNVSNCFSVYLQRSVFLSNPENTLTCF